MKESDLETSLIKKKFFWLSLIPIVVLISIQFFVLAQDVEIAEVVEIVNENSEDYAEIIKRNDLSSHYLFSLSGTASHYAHRFHNRRTASGERFNMFDNTAAHRKLPFGTIIKVTNLANGKATLVRINDRGPHIRNRVLDLSYGAAKEIAGMGLPRVKIEGFLRNKHNIGLKFDNEYFYAYSLIENPVCVPKSVVSFIDSTADFQQAMAIYQTKLEGKFAENVFIIVNSDLPHKDKNSLYYIGTIGKTSSPKLDLTKF